MVDKSVFDMTRSSRLFTFDIPRNSKEYKIRQRTACDHNCACQCEAPKNYVVFHLLLLDPRRNRSNSLPNSSAKGSKLSSPNGFHSDISADSGRNDPVLKI